MCKIPCIRPTDLPKLSSSAGRVGSPSTIRGLRAPGDMGLTGDTGPDTGLIGCGDCTGSDPAPGDMGIPRRNHRSMPRSPQQPVRGVGGGTPA